MTPSFNIAPKPPAPFEARIVIWRSEGIESQDSEGVSDLYIRAWLDNAVPKETDTHYRCPNGRGNWNWRLLFPLTIPQESHSFTIQVWDRDLFSGNDLAGETSVAFNELARTAWEQGGRVKMTGEAEGTSHRLLRRTQEKFWTHLTKRGGEHAGKVLISFELVPLDRARACAVGEGRAAPNVDPFLPEPLGRFKWSLNPLTVISQLCGPEFKARVCCLVCCALCYLVLMFMSPMILSDGVSSLLFR